MPESLEETKLRGHMGTVLGNLLYEANCEGYGFFIVLADPIDAGDTAGVPFALSNVKRAGMEALVEALRCPEKSKIILDCAEHNYDRLSEKVQGVIAEAERRDGIKEH